jgi:hypothetical protein
LFCESQVKIPRNKKDIEKFRITSFFIFLNRYLKNLLFGLKDISLLHVMCQKLIFMAHSEECNLAEKRAFYHIFNHCGSKYEIGLNN